MAFPSLNLGLIEGNSRWGFAPSPQKNPKILAAYPQATHSQQLAQTLRGGAKQRLTRCSVHSFTLEHCARHDDVCSPDNARTARLDLAVSRTEYATPKPSRVWNDPTEQLENFSSDVARADGVERLRHPERRSLA